MTRVRPALTCLLLFAVSLALRMVGLGSFLTPDENLWATRTTQFLAALNAHDWAATNITGHPGVTTMWAGGLGLIARWLLARPSDAPTFLASLSELAADPVRLDTLPWLRMPVAIACAAAIVAAYLLARRVMDERAALLGAGLLLFDPFLLAHGRLLQMDGLLAAGIAVAWLALAAALRTGQRRFYLLSGLSIGAALLTKSPALVMGPLMLGAIVLVRIRERGPVRRRLGRILLDLLWTGVPAAIIIFLLWPALWVEPLTTLGRVWGLMTAYGGGEHELGSYWLGQPAAEPGSLFYLVALALRTTPATSIGLLLALVAAAFPVWGRHQRSMPVADAMRRSGSVFSENAASTLSGARRTASAAVRHPRPAPCGVEGAAIFGLAPLSLLAFVLWFGIVLTLGAKKFDRYLLPIFPAVDLLAAWGWMVALRWTAARLRARGGAWRSLAASGAAMGGAALLVAIQAWAALASQPSYLTAYNPLAGGIRAAAHILPVGWGEGLDEAAAYLDNLPGAKDGRVAAWYGKNVFAAFYRGTSFDLYYDTPTAADLYANDVDWVVTYISQEQRGLVDPSVAAQLGAPLYTVARDGVTLASVYAWPKPFAHTTDRPIGEGLRLLGWQVGDHDRRAGALPVTLYWDAADLAAVPGGRVVVWMKDAAGEVWAAADEKIDAGAQACPISQAAGCVQPDRPVVAQPFTLRPPVGLSPGVYRIEIAPFAGSSVGLATVEIGPTRLSEVTSLGPQVQAPPGEVRFGDIARLVGSSLDAGGDAWTIDLVWAWLAQPGEPYHYFIHVVDAGDRLIAQQDGPLPQYGAPGELARQRIHLALPQGTAAAAYRVVVGLYRPRDGARAPLVANGQPVPDGRYLLATRP